MAITFKKETVLALIDAEIAKTTSTSTEIEAVKTREQEWVDEQMAVWDNNAKASKLAAAQEEHRQAEALRKAFADAGVVAEPSDHNLLKRVVESLHDRTVDFNGEATAYIKASASEAYWLHERNRYVAQVSSQASYYVQQRRHGRAAPEPKRTISLHEAREVVKLTTGDVLTMTDLKSLGVYRLVLDSAPKPAEAKKPKKVDDEVIEPEIVE